MLRYIREEASSTSSYEVAEDAAAPRLHSRERSIGTASGRRVLLLVSSDVAKDRQSEVARPRRDYDLLADLLDADVFDFGSVFERRAGRLLAKTLGKGVAHALLTRSMLPNYDVVFSDSEHVGLMVGIVLRTLNRRPRHVVLGHHLTPKKKHMFFYLAKNRIDRLILHSRAQHELAVSHLHMRAEKVEVLPYQVDTHYWAPQPSCQDTMIATAGLECRDYITLSEAVSGLSLSVCIGAASHWSKKRNALTNALCPPNVKVSSYNYEELRSLYARSLFVVVPLLDVDFQAGITTILEAMAMGKAVVLTKTRGQCNVVIGPLWGPERSVWPEDGPSIEASSGIFVPPGDAASLRSAIKYLQSNPDVAATLGKNGRKQVEADYTVEHFASRFAEMIALEAAH